MMEPTVGRVVYYKSYGTPGGEYPQTDRAAIITEVIDEETVSLCVMNPEGLFFNKNVTRGVSGGHWDWMPYQKQKASEGDHNSESAEPRI